MTVEEIMQGLVDHCGKHYDDDKCDCKYEGNFGSCEIGFIFDLKDECYKSDMLTFGKMCYQQGRTDVIAELKPYVLTNMDDEQFLWLKVDELNKLSFAEQLKEQNE